MTIYQIKSSATRAAKKAHGDDYLTKCQIIPVEGGFIIQTEKIVTVEVAPSLISELATTEVLVANDKDIADKAAKKAELMAQKPQHIPKLPAGALVAEKSTPNPTPALPPSLISSPPADEEVDHSGSNALIANFMAQGDTAANTAAVNVDPARPRMSTIPLPTKKVWDVADSMPGAKRKEVIEACVAAGIAYGTARTQYQHWFKCINDQKTAPLAVIGADGKITIPTK